MKWKCGTVKASNAASRFCILDHFRMRKGALVTWEIRLCHCHRHRAFTLLCKSYSFDDECFENGMLFSIFFRSALIQSSLKFLNWNNSRECIVTNNPFCLYCSHICYCLVLKIPCCNSLFITMKFQTTKIIRKHKIQTKNMWDIL